MSPENEPIMPGYGEEEPRRGGSDFQKLFNSRRITRGRLKGASDDDRDSLAEEYKEQTEELRGLVREAKRETNDIDQLNGAIETVLRGAGKEGFDTRLQGKISDSAQEQENELESIQYAGGNHEFRKYKGLYSEYANDVINYVNAKLYGDEEKVQEEIENSIVGEENLRLFDDEIESLRALGSGVASPAGEGGTEYGQREKELRVEHEKQKILVALEERNAVGDMLNFDFAQRYPVGSEPAYFRLLPSTPEGKRKREYLKATWQIQTGATVKRVGMNSPDTYMDNPASRISAKDRQTLYDNPGTRVMYEAYARAVVLHEKYDVLLDNDEEKIMKARDKAADEGSDPDEAEQKVRGKRGFGVHTIWDVKTNGDFEKFRKRMREENLQAVIPGYDGAHEEGITLDPNEPFDAMRSGGPISEPEGYEDFKASTNALLADANAWADFYTHNFMESMVNNVSSIDKEKFKKLLRELHGDEADEIEKISVDSANLPSFMVAGEYSAVVSPQTQFMKRAWQGRENFGTMGDWGTRQMRKVKEKVKFDKDKDKVRFVATDNKRNFWNANKTSEKSPKGGRWVEVQVPLAMPQLVIGSAWEENDMEIYNPEKDEKEKITLLEGLLESRNIKFRGDFGAYFGNWNKAVAVKDMFLGMEQAEVGKTGWAYSWILKYREITGESRLDLNSKKDKIRESYPNRPVLSDHNQMVFAAMASNGGPENPNDKVPKLKDAKRWHDAFRHPKIGIFSGPFNKMKVK